MEWYYKSEGWKSLFYGWFYGAIYSAKYVIITLEVEWYDKAVW